MNTMANKYNYYKAQRDALQQQMSNTKKTSIDTNDLIKLTNLDMKVSTLKKRKNKYVGPLYNILYPEYDINAKSLKSHLKTVAKVCAQCVAICGIVSIYPPIAIPMLGYSLYEVKKFDFYMAKNISKYDPNLKGKGRFSKALHAFAKVINIRENHANHTGVKSIAPENKQAPNTYNLGTDRMQDIASRIDKLRNNQVASNEVAAEPTKTQNKTNASVLSPQEIKRVAGHYR